MHSGSALFRALAALVYRVRSCPFIPHLPRRVKQNLPLISGDSQDVRTDDCTGNPGTISGSLRFLFHEKDGSGLIPRMRWQAGDTGEEVKGGALAPDAQDNALGFLVPHDQLPFVRQ